VGLCFRGGKGQGESFLVIKNSGEGPERERGKVITFIILGKPQKVGSLAEGEIKRKGGRDQGSKGGRGGKERRGRLFEKKKRKKEGNDSFDLDGVTPKEDFRKGKKEGEKGTPLLRIVTKKAMCNLRR